MRAAAARWAENEAAAPTEQTAKAVTDEKFAALEALTQCCAVSVDREPYRNGHAWYVTFSAPSDAVTDDASSVTFAALSAMVVNGEGFTAAVDHHVDRHGLQLLAVSRLRRLQLVQEVGGRPVAPAAER